MSLPTVRNERLEEEFWQEREKVLAEWPTGKEVNLDEAIAYHKSLPPSKNWSKRFQVAKRDGETLVNVVGMGHGTLEMQLELITYAQNEGQADLLGTTIDNFTRLHDYEGAERGRKESERLGQTVLNGLPLVNYGVAAIRKLVEAVNVPMTLKFAALDPRLIVEIGLAAGHTDYDGADTTLPFLLHNSKTPLEKVLFWHQYVFRLMGYYEENGCPISSGAYGGAGLLTPPSLTCSEIIIEALMMVKQGVKTFTFHYPAQGNLMQDVASARACPKLLQEYLNRFGYNDVQIILSFQNGSYTRLPDDLARSYGVLAQHALATRLAGAQESNPRSITEGKYIPGKEALADTFKCAKTVINMFKIQKVELDDKALDVEADMFKREVKAITDAVIDLGDGDVVIGMIKAIQAGVIDHAFGTHPSVACKIMGVRDAQGAVRWFDKGNLPLSREIMEFHQEKLAERARNQGKPIDYDTLASDIVALSDGVLILPT